MSTPRVTVAIAATGQEPHLPRAIESALAQDFDDFEVLVVEREQTVAHLLLDFDDERLRVVRETGPHQSPHDTFLREGRGELIAWLREQDLAATDRLRRQVELFDLAPETALVHGGARLDDTGSVIAAPDLSGPELVTELIRDTARLHYSTCMVHRRVYEEIGSFDPTFTEMGALEFWLRAARRFVFRAIGGSPLAAIRRATATTAPAVTETERAIESAIARYSLRELLGELDWNSPTAARDAKLELAAIVDTRTPPLPALAARLRERAQSEPQPPVRRTPKRLMMTSFGFNDSGGGTTVPRLAAKELARRGWDVTVFHAAVGATPAQQPYEVLEWEDSGVRLIGVHNRGHGLFDIGNPTREIDDPPISAAFAAALDRLQPDVVHFHNLHNLGATLMDEVASRGLPAYFSTHNYWLTCQRVYLMHRDGSMCAGPGDGSRCAECVGSAEEDLHRRRLTEIRSRASRSLTAILAVSDSVRRTLIGAGYPPQLIDVVRQGMPQDTQIWDQLGSGRKPGRAGQELTVAFVGSAYPHKGPQLLVEAAQHTQAQVRVKILGELPSRFEPRLKALDVRGVVDFHGPFAPEALAELLADVDAVALPSLWWDCAPLVAAECRAARIPLIAPRLGGLAEVLTDDLDGLFFDPLDATDLARKLDRLALEPGLLERLQSAIAPPHAFSDYIDELEAYYDGERPGTVAADAPLTPALRWKGDHDAPTSLSIINREVSSRLAVDLQRVARNGETLDGPLPHGADVEVHHQWPPDFEPPAAGRLAVIAPWEFGAPPSTWVDAITDHVDELWVPSEAVRSCYVGAGIDPTRVVTIPNGVDLDLFTPTGPARPLPDAQGVRFLFVGGLIWRKGPDVLHRAFCEAFAQRDDVTLVIKDFGADGIYRSGERDALRAHVQAGALPRILLLDETMSTEELAALYRACDVLVHPYRGEGFAMGVLEAMACGLPSIVTTGGPTDEFCPPQASWRINSTRAHFPEDRVDSLATLGRPWVLEPDVAHLRELLIAVAADSDERQRRGAAARQAAQKFSWDAVSALYGERINALMRRAPLAPPLYPFPDDFTTRVLATPAWRGTDQLGELLREWTTLSTPQMNACLYLLADTAIDGETPALQQRVEEAAQASGVSLEHGADITILLEGHHPERDLRLHRAINAYVPLHPACAGHERMARAAARTVVSLGTSDLARVLRAQGATANV